MPHLLKYRIPLLISLFLIEGASLFSQIILLEEDFSSAVGSTPPAGWTVQMVTGDPLVDVWRFDNPGRRSPASPITDSYACFDSDKLSDNGLAEEVYLVSPVFDATTEDGVLLEFDQYFLSGLGGSCEVEVFDGSSWISIYSNSVTTSNPQHSSFSLTSLVQNITNAQIRFKWTGDYSWYWIIDNVEVVIFELDIFAEQDGVLLRGIYSGSIDWGDYDNDDDLDILMTGNSNIGRISKIYRNNGDNTFSEQTEILLCGVKSGSGSWGDYDNDGDLDILLTGNLIYGWTFNIYRNNSNNTFTEQYSISSTDVIYGQSAWGDYDNDGDLDILLTEDYISKIYRNNSDNTFSKQTDILLSGNISGSDSWGDYDNDGYLDIILVGYDINSRTISKIYRNNGDKTFSEQTDISFDIQATVAAVWGDYDNDGDLDLLISGSSPEGYITVVYKNNGDNSFSEQTSFSLYGPGAWGDYDNDGDLDILLIGSDTSNYYNSKIYRNNGDNTFSEQTNISLIEVSKGTVSWIDYDNDNDLDILLTGNPLSSGYISKIYQNTNLTKNTPPTVPQNLTTDVNWQDVLFHWDKSTDIQTPQSGLSYNLVISDTQDGCNILSPMSNINTGFRKVVQIGNASQNNFYNFHSSLIEGSYYWTVQAIDHAFVGSVFANPIGFNVTEVPSDSLSFNDIFIDSATIHWKRGNKEKCVVFMKNDSLGIPTLTDNTSYNANPNFGLGSQAGEDWFCVYNGTGDSVTVTNLFGGAEYVVMVVEYSSSIGQEIYYPISNTTNPNTFSTMEQFTEQSNISIRGVNSGFAAWGDFDSDADQDILLTGEYTTTEFIAKIYSNNSNNALTEQTGISLTGVREGSIALGDYDNNGDLDILISGSIIDGTTTRLYKNDGNSNFIEQAEISLTSGRAGSVAFGDYDNDGDLDILLAGYGFSKIYQNNDDNSFTDQSGISLIGVYIGSVAWGDYDNDGDLDILLAGYGFSKIYQNNGDKSFTEQTDILLSGGNFGSVAWGDYDSDGDLDILLTGKTNSGPISKIYRNNFDNSFTEQTDISLTGVYYSSAAWGDYDNDGDLDILLKGYDQSKYITLIYKNNGDNSFTVQNTNSLTGVYNSSVAWGDYDKDGDLDIFSSGSAVTSPSKIFLNNNLRKNNKPGIPSGIIAYVSNGKFHISWEKSTDSETPQDGLTYNLRIGTTSGGCDIMSPMSLADGTRKIVSMGNVQHNTEWVINLPVAESGNIYYSVQSVDNGYLASDWSPELSSLNSLVADFTPTSVCQRNDIQYLDNSSYSEYPIESYFWRFIEDGIVMDSSSLQNASYAFQSYTGINQVELSVTNSKGESVTRIKTIDVSPSPLADFTAPNVCQGELTTLTNTTQANTTTITDLLWDFDDGSPSSVLEDPESHSYNPGTYDLSLTVNSDNNCQLTTTREVIVAALPSGLLSITGNTSYCSNENTSLSAIDDIFYTYQWKDNGAIITDSINQKIYPKASGSYSVSISNTLASNCITESDPVSLSVRSSPPVVGITPPSGSEFCLNDTSSQLSAPYVAGLTYNWMVDSKLAGSGSNIFIPTQSGTYTLSVSNVENCSQVSPDTVYDIVINPIPSVPGITSPSPTFCSGKPFTMETPFSAVLNYQWLDNGNIIPDSVNNSFSPSTSGKYSVKITQNSCSNFSVPIDITILPLPSSPTVIMRDLSEFCVGDSVVLSVTDNTDLDYQWLESGFEIPFATNNSFVVNEFGSYGVRITNADLCEATSLEAIMVTVIDTPNISIIEKDGPIIFCEGGSVTLSVNNEPTWYYQWRKDDYLISGTNAFNYLVSGTGNYQVTATNSQGCFSNSNTQFVNEVQRPTPPFITAQSDTIFCEGESVLLSTTFNDLHTYSWKLNGGDLISHSNEYEAFESGLYRLDIVIAGAEDCSNAFSNTIEVVMLPSPESLVITTDETQLCQGEETILGVEQIDGLTYRWIRDLVPIPGGSGNEYIVSQFGDYTVETEDANGCTSLSSNIITVNTYEKPQIPIIGIIGGASLICPGEFITLELDNPQAKYNYRWLKNGQEMSDTVYSLSGSLDAAEYSVVANIGNCKTESDRQLITYKSVLPKPDIIAEGSTVWYLACSNDTANIYRWYHENMLISDGSDYLYVANQELGKYHVEISGYGECFVSSDVISIPENIILNTNELNPWEKMRIYPNPTQGKFTLEMDNAIMGDLIIEIFTETGSKIINIKFLKEINHFSTQIDLSEQPGGVYLIGLMLEDYRTSRSLVVE